MGVFETLIGILTKPDKTLENEKKASFGSAVVYGLILLLIYFIINTIILIVSPSMSSKSSDVIKLALGISMPAGASVILISLLTLVLFVIIALLAGLWLHVVIKLFSGKGSLGQTYKSIIYSATPISFLSWIPLVSIVAGVWSLYLQVLGLRKFHEVKSGTASAIIIAYIISLYILMIIFASIFVKPIDTSFLMAQ